MTDNATDSLVTEPASAPKTAAPAAPIVNPDPAAALDPAKTAQATAKPARARKRASAKARSAARGKARAATATKSNAQRSAARAARSHDQASADECRAAYASATASRVENYTRLPENSPVVLRFANGSEFVEGERTVEPEDLAADGDRTTYAKAVDFDPDAGPAMVSEAWLIAASGEAVCCAIGVGMKVGGGQHGLIPAGHLIF